MSVVEAIPGRPGNKRNATAPMGGDEGSAFFGRAIDIRGNDAIRCKFNRLDGDGEVVVRGTVVLADSSFRVHHGPLAKDVGGREQGSSRNGTSRLEEAPT